MKKTAFILFPVILIANVMFGQVQQIKLQLPGDLSFKNYFVNRVGDKFILNGDIVIPVSPSAKQTGVLKKDQDGKIIVPGTYNVESYTADDKHFTFWTVKSYKWPGGRIPVEIDQSVYDTKSCSAVKDALDYMNAMTCLIFYPRTNEDDYVSIAVSTDPSNGAGGNSPVGKQGGKQTITMFSGRFSKFSLSHELMHAAGVYHEQSRADRDNYISIDISRVLDGQQHNFQVEGDATAHGAYDYCSIMQYPAAAFAIDPSKPVITCRANGTTIACPACMGSLSGLSNADIKGLSDYYGQIGVSRFPTGGSFPMPCGEQYDITQLIIRASGEPAIYAYSGGVIDKTLAIPTNGNPTDGGGYFLPGKQNHSFFYYSLKSKTVTENGGAIRDRYEKEGVEHGALGWPEINQATLQGGAFQRFNHGHIYWSPAAGAFVVKGPIFDAWAKTGWERGPLGFPETEVVILPGGAFQQFNHGHIYWTAKYGPFVVSGSIFDAWAKENWEKGPLGYPVSDFISNRVAGTNTFTSVNDGGTQKFESGYIELQITNGPNGQHTSSTSVHLYSKEQKSVTPGRLPQPNTPKTADSLSPGNSRYRNVPPGQTPGSKKPAPGSKSMINPQPLPPKQINQ